MTNETTSDHATLMDIVAAQRRWRDAARNLARRRSQLAPEVIASIETALVDLGPAIGIDRAASEILRIGQVESSATAVVAPDPTIAAAQRAAESTTRSVDSAVESARRIPTLSERLEMARRSVQDNWAAGKSTSKPS